MRSAPPPEARRSRTLYSSALRHAPTPRMTTLVFRLRNVPDEEADEVRALLDEARIDWYETTAGNWGIAMPGLWVADAAEAARARALVDDYQRERTARLAGRVETVPFATLLRERPLAVLAILAFCAFILYVSINPFLQLVARSS